MNAPFLTELPYLHDGTALFAHVAHSPWSAYLDSGHPGSTYGRYDILVADPFITLTTRGERTVIMENGSETESGEHPFTLLQNLLSRFPAPAGHLPFCGGALGYFSYDLARRLENLPEIAVDAELIPTLAIGIYDWAVVLDHQCQKAWLVGQGHDKRTAEQWSRRVAQFSVPHQGAVSDPFRVVSSVSANMDWRSYRAAFQRIARYISEGDCYQVNFAQRFSASVSGDAWEAYCYLRGISPAPYAAYLNTPDACVLSVSPERFLRVCDRNVETRPIKGTRPRATDPELDRQRAQELLSSAKDRAENLMIVDLLRNDISKSCAIGSVRADYLFALESFANVHHLVSTVTGHLAPGYDAVDLLHGCFPGGSVTGTPKLRAMQIIEALEPHRRGVYCGAIGYIGFDGSMDTNIAIRTAVCSGGTIRFWAGGGIVADSVAEAEYCETWDKAACMLRLMEHFHADR